MYEWLMGIEYNEVYFLFYLNCENFMELSNYYDNDVGELYMYLDIYVVGEFSYMQVLVKLLVNACTFIAVEIAVEYSRWIVVNICIVDWVICSCIICWVGCLHPYCRWPDTCIHIAVEIIVVDNDVQLTSWGDDLGGDLVPHAYRCRV